MNRTLAGDDREVLASLSTLFSMITLALATWASPIGEIGLILVFVAVGFSLIVRRLPGFGDAVFLMVAIVLAGMSTGWIVLLVPGAVIASAGLRLAHSTSRPPSRRRLVVAVGITTLLAALLQWLVPPARIDLSAMAEHDASAPGWSSIVVSVSAFVLLLAVGGICVFGRFARGRLLFEWLPSD